MSRILIIEDEAIAASKLERLILELDPETEVLEKLTSVASAVRWLSSQKAELIFLDINLSDDLSFKIFQEVEIDTPIIFTTAYDQYAIQAFDLNSVAYLLKPIDRDELRKALEKFKKHFQSQGYMNQVQSVLNSLEEVRKGNRSTRIVVSYGGKMRGIDQRDIAAFYSSEKITWLYTRGGTKYVLDKSLDQMQQELSSDDFFRINRKFLVQLDAIAEIIPFSSRRLKVEMAIDLPESILVPTEKITRFKEWFKS